MIYQAQRTTPSRLLKFCLPAIAAAIAITGCNRSRPDVAQEKENLKATQEKVAKDVEEAQKKAIKDVNDTKEDGARRIQNARKSLQEAQDQANGLTTPIPPATDERSTQSGSTTAQDDDGEDDPVTPSECAKYALEKSIQPELKDRYQACSKLIRESN